jgi:iron complex transport system ATP-binding protein
MLEAKELTYVVDQKKLIHSVSLTFYPKKFYGILGENGAGKSTLLKLLSKIWTPSQGVVRWEGEELHKKNRSSISRLISLVPQTTDIPFDFSVEEVVYMGRHPHDEKIVRSDLLFWALNTVDAWHLKTRLITSLSQGEKQRVIIARALMTEAPILLLDEPASSLDLRHQLEIWNLMKELSQKGKLIIATNHDIALTRRFCDEVIVLKKGEAIAQGPTKTTLTQRLIEEVFGIKERENVFELIY